MIRADLVVLSALLFVGLQEVGEFGSADSRVQLEVAADRGHQSLLLHLVLWFQNKK